VDWDNLLGASVVGDDQRAEAEEVGLIERAHGPVKHRICGEGRLTRCRVENHLDRVI
jgi:hypothetical protein